MKQKADKKAQVEHSKISLAIFEYITTQLNHCIEDDVFEAGSIKELGYVYYKKILTANVSFSEEHVRAFIRRFARDDSHIEHDSDYFEELCAYIGIKELPKAVRQEVFRKYNEVFVQMYASVLSKHNAAIKQVEREEAQAEKDINAILSGRSSIPISHDITAAEEELIAIYRKQDELRSRKDALEFAKDMVDSFLLRFSRSIPQKDSDRIDSRRLKQKVKKAKNMIRNCRVHLFDRWYHQLSIHESEHDLSPVERAIRKNSLDICKGFSTAEKVVLPYKGYLDWWKDDIERPYALSFKIKCYSIREVGKKRYFHQCSLLGEEKAYNLYIEQLNKLPPIEELYNAKNHNPSYYLDLLRKLVRDFNIFSEMKSTLSETVCLRYRKEFLLKAITLFETGEYSIVNCIIPLQIEGIFFDFLIDQTTFSRFKDLDLFPQEVLKDKIKILLEMKEGIYPEAAEYFQNYYNNLVRNPAAHGRYYGNNDPTIEEITALEQMLDLNFLVYMVSRISETDKMHRFIKGYVSNCALFDHSEHPCFGALFRDIIGSRTHADYDMLDVYEPLHIAFWIVNPYYERIYKSVDDGKDLMDLRKEFLSPEFWSFVLSELDHTSPKDIHKDFGKVITGLFRCNISSAMKMELQKVNKKYGEIKHLQ